MADKYGLELTTVPRDLYYHEVDYVRGLEAKVAERDKRIVELEAFVEMVAGLPGSCSRQICARARALRGNGK